MASGSDAPAKGMTGDRAVATAAAGAMAVIDWNNTSDMPIASFLSVISPAALIGVGVVSEAPFKVSDISLSPLLWVSMFTLQQKTRGMCSIMNFHNQNRSCHAEHIRFAQCKLREASLCPERQTLRCAQGDNTLPILVGK